MSKNIKKTLKSTTSGNRGPTSGIRGPTSGIRGPTSGILGPTSGILGPTSGILGPTSGNRGQRSGDVKFKQNWTEPNELYDFMYFSVSSVTCCTFPKFLYSLGDFLLALKVVMVWVVVGCQQLPPLLCPRGVRVC
jgi:hypothetical protein